MFSRELATFFRISFFEEHLLTASSGFFKDTEPKIWFLFWWCQRVNLQLSPKFLSSAIWTFCSQIFSNLFFYFCNTFQVNVPILYPPEKKQKTKGFLVFAGGIIWETLTRYGLMQMSEDSGTQQAQSRRHIVVTSLNDWLYRRCQIVENERFADVNLERCGNVNPLSANFIKWSNTLKQFVGNLPTNCLSVFDHFVGLALKGLRSDVVTKLWQRCDNVTNFEVAFVHFLS